MSLSTKIDQHLAIRHIKMYTSVTSSLYNFC